MSKVEVDTLAPATGTTITIGESGDTVVLGSGATQTGFGTVYNPYRNLIINGDMSIDQRNSGSAVTGISNTSNYIPDRFQIRVDGSGSGRMTGQQVTDAPTNFKNSLKITVTTTDASPTASEGYAVRQSIEGQNITQLNFGTANAQSITVSFYVKSSLTGDFSLNIGNGSSNRWYGALYTINTADTWERKTVTISGDTTGTWSSDNSSGLVLIFGLGGGSSRTVTPNTWQTGSGTQTFTTGATNLFATSSATWQVTGVQLEVGTSASDFEFLPYDVNLLRCQRYYHQIGYGLNGAGGTVNAGQGQWYNSGEVTLTVYFPTSMRATPSMTSPTVSNGYRFHKAGSFSDVSDGGSINSPSNMMTGIYKSGLTGGTGGDASFLAMIASGAAYKFDAEL